MGGFWSAPLSQRVRRWRWRRAKGVYLRFAHALPNAASAGSGVR